MASKICTNCGYEGTAIKRPDDSAGERDNATQEAFTKVANLFSVLTFIPIKPLAMLLAAPFYILLWPLKRWMRGDGKKWCPNCGLPTMVKLKSDAGWLAKRKNDIKSGAVVIGREEGLKLAFGKEVVLPGDEKKPARAEPPRPERLPSLDEILAPPPPPEPAEPVAAPQPVIPKKKADPDTW